MAKVSLQYVGVKPVHEDTLYGTGTWGKGAKKDVDAEIAPFLLYHDDVWRDARAKAIREKDPIKPLRRPPIIRPHERDVAPFPVNLAVLDQKGLASYAKSTFNRELDTSKPVEALRAEVRTLIRMAP